MKREEKSKYVLGIETALTLSVAVTAGDSLAAQRSIDAGRDMDSLLPGAVGEILEIAGINPVELFGIAVSSGPGSFTGLRIGLAAARGLALALDKPVAGIPTLDGMCYRVNPSVDCLICPLLDAKNGKVYSCLYSYSSAAGRKERISGYTAMPLGEILEGIRERTIFLCGEAFREPIKEKMGDDAILMPPEYGRPEAASIAMLGYSRLLESQPGIYDLRPVYVRRPEAEEKAAAELPEPSVAPLRPEDLGQIMEIEQASFPSPWSEEMFRNELRKEHAVFLAARCEGRVAGYIGGWLIYDEFHVANFAVSPAMRGRGIGKNLLKNIIDRVKSEGAACITLEVRERNLPAIAMYRKFGFSAAGRRKAYYCDSGEDALIMSMQFGKKTS